MGSMRDIARQQEVAIALEGRTMATEEVEEFYNENHSERDGRFISGVVRAGLGVGIAAYAFKDVMFQGKKVSAKEVEKSLRDSGKDLVTPDQRKAERRAKIKKIALIAGGVALAAGVVFLGVQVKKANDEDRAAAARAETHRIPGSDKKFTRRWTTKDKQGRDLHVLDASGKLTEKQAKGLLEQLKMTSDRNPVEGRAARIVVHDRHHGSPTANAFVMNRPGARGINFNYDSMYGGGFAGRLNRFVAGVIPWHSPVSKDKTASHKGQGDRYTVAHEYGHVLDLDGERKAVARDRAAGVQDTRTEVQKLMGIRGRGPGHDYHVRRESIFQRQKRRKGAQATPKRNLSIYGRTNGHEAYAESFAEWDLSGGKTGNDTARDYAAEHGWK